MFQTFLQAKPLVAVLTTAGLTKEQFLTQVCSEVVLIPLDL